MSDILFIRHGATDLAGTFCGHSDPPLNQRGQQQVAALIDQLAGEAIGAVYSSDLLRARETADAVAKARGVALHTLPGLREIHFGAWEGLSWSEIEARDASFAQRWLAEYPRLAAPGGEAVSAFEERVLATVEMLLQKEARPFAVVSHAGVMRVILRRLCGLAEDACFAQTRDYCAVIRYPNTPSIAAVPPAVDWLNEEVAL
jgi:broad specificity phosphatase PhoE